MISIEFFDSESNDRQYLQKNEIDYAIIPNIDLIFDLLKKLPLHFKLVLYAFIKIYDHDKKNIKVRVEDVFTEYQKLTTELKINWLSMNKVTNIIKELEVYGFLKCKYVRKGQGQIKYINILNSSDIPRYKSALQEELEKIQLE